MGCVLVLAAPAVAMLAAEAVAIRPISADEVEEPEDDDDDALAPVSRLANPRSRLSLLV
jgi:hypothetical protein